MVGFVFISCLLTLLSSMVCQASRLLYRNLVSQQSSHGLSGTWMMCQQYHTGEFMEFFDVPSALQWTAYAASYGVKGATRVIDINTVQEQEHLVTYSNSMFGSTTEIILGDPMKTVELLGQNAELQAYWDTRENADAKPNDLRVSVVNPHSKIEGWISVEGDGSHKRMLVLLKPFKEITPGSFIPGDPMAEIWRPAGDEITKPCGNLPATIAKTDYETDFNTLVIEADAFEQRRSSRSSNRLMTMIDMTEHFRPDLKQVELTDGVTYSCCCWHDTPTNRITCELMDVSLPWASWFRSGCGGIMGYGFHSWNTIPTLEEYGDTGDFGDLPGVGQCVVPYWKLPNALRPSVLDITEKFPPESISARHDNGVSATLDDGADYVCCCKLTTDLDCILWPHSEALQYASSASKASKQNSSCISCGKIMSILRPGKTEKQETDSCALGHLAGLGYLTWYRVRNPPKSNRCVVPSSMLPPPTD